MKLNEVKEIGFYVAELDIERKIIYEIIKNTDKKWLKEDPEQTLLIDKWTYENTDTDDRKHYEIYDGNLVAIKLTEPIDVIKITDTKYILGGINGTHLMENKPTKLELANQQIATLQAELQAEKEKVKELEDMLQDPEVRVALTDVRTGERELWYKLGSKADKYKQALEEIRQIVIFSIEEVLTLGQKNATDEILQKCEVLDE